MLRRIFTRVKLHHHQQQQHGGLKKLSGSNAVAATATAATILCQHRNFIFFSEQEKTLAEKQQQTGYKSNLWVTSEHLGGTIPTTALRGESHTEVMVLKTVELWNASQFEPPALPEAEPEVHSSVKTGRPFGRLFQSEMEERAQKHKLTSKLWLSWHEARDRRLIKKPNALSSLIPVTYIERCFNADQLSAPEVLLQIQVSGLSNKRIYGRKKEALAAAQKQHAYPTGLWFLDSDLDLLQLAARSGEVAVRSAASPSKGWYNFEQIVGFEDFLKNRSPPSEHTVLASGHPIRIAALREKMSSSNFSSKYWVSPEEIARDDWKLAPGAVPVSLDTAWPEGYFNVAQLTDPSAAFGRAGLYIR